MKSGIFVNFALLLSISSALHAAPMTNWERYLATLSEADAESTTEMAYSNVRSDGDRLSDLQLLATQVQAGDAQVYLLAVRLAERTLPGETLEVLAEMISRLVRVNPTLFLIGQVRNGTCFGVDFLGGPFVDRSTAAREHELSMRVQALSAVQVPALQEAKRSCIALLQR